MHRNARWLTVTAAVSPYPSRFFAVPDGFESGQLGVLRRD